VQSGEHTDSGDVTASGTPDTVMKASSALRIGGRPQLVAIHLMRLRSSRFMPLSSKCSSRATSAVQFRCCDAAQFQSFRVGSDIYHVATPLVARLTLWFMEFVAGRGRVMILAFLLAMRHANGWRSKARARLRMMKSETSSGPWW